MSTFSFRIEAEKFVRASAGHNPIKFHPVPARRWGEVDHSTPAGHDLLASYLMVLMVGGRLLNLRPVRPWLFHGGRGPFSKPRFMSPPTRCQSPLIASAVSCLRKGARRGRAVFRWTPSGASPWAKPVSNELALADRLIILRNLPVH